MWADKVTTELENMATCLEQMGVKENVGPHQIREVILNFENTRLKLRIIWTPAGFRKRAKELSKQAKYAHDCRTDNAKEAANALKYKISLRRPRYSKAVAQRFIDDGEIENYKNYRMLFGLAED